MYKSFVLCPDTAESTSSSDEPPMAFHSAVHNERNRCISMLTNLAQVLEHEYSTGGLAHWGSEDRRTKMYFVSLDRSLIYNIITVLLGQVCAGLIGTWIKVRVGFSILRIACLRHIDTLVLLCAAFFDGTRSAPKGRVKHRKCIPEIS
jgi:hypothetical protein